MKQLITILIVLALVGAGAYFLLQDKTTTEGTPKDGSEMMEEKEDGAMMEDKDSATEDGAAMETSANVEVQ